MGVDKYLRTFLELYPWMERETSGVYFQTSRPACDLAKRAERAFRWELGVDESVEPFMDFGHWDNLK